MIRLLFALFSLLLVACATPQAATADDVAEPRNTDVAAEVDYSCEVDADCAVKNVGNCCGYYPACVNRDSPTFPERVKAECEKEGRMSVCGFPSISSCECRSGRCEAVTGADRPLEVR